MLETWSDFCLRMLIKSVTKIKIELVKIIIKKSLALKRMYYFDVKFNMKIIK